MSPGLPVVLLGAFLVPWDVITLAFRLGEDDEVEAAEKNRGNGPPGKMDDDILEMHKDIIEALDPDGKFGSPKKGEVEDVCFDDESWCKSMASCQKKEDCDDSDAESSGSSSNSKSKDAEEDADAEEKSKAKAKSNGNEEEHEDVDDDEVPLTAAQRFKAEAEKKRAELYKKSKKKFYELKKEFEVREEAMKPVKDEMSLIRLGLTRFREKEKQRKKKCEETKIIQGDGVTEATKSDFHGD